LGTPGAFRVAARCARIDAAATDFHATAKPLRNVSENSV
jgi:hypothetical protein